LEGRSVPKGEEQWALVGVDLDIADTDGVMREFINTQEARACFMREKGMVVVEQMALVSSGSGSTAVDLAPDMVGLLERVRAPGRSGEI
jgi:hypothetical protein